jgi:hypothetical protein
VCRAPPVPAQLVEQLLRRTLRRAGVACGQDGAEAIPALGIGLDTAAEIELKLTRFGGALQAFRGGFTDA